MVRRGFGLIEVLVSLTLLGVALLGVTSSTLFALRLLREAEATEQGAQRRFRSSTRSCRKTVLSMASVQPASTRSAGRSCAIPQLFAGTMFRWRIPEVLALTRPVIVSRTWRGFHDATGRSRFFPGRTANGTCTGWAGHRDGCGPAARSGANGPADLRTHTES